MFQENKKLGNGRIMITYNGLSCEGTLVGLTVSQVKEMLEKQLPADTARLPDDAVVYVTTMNDEDEAWKAVASEQENGLVTAATDGVMQIFQGVTKNVPGEYVIRPADIFLRFIARAE